MDPVFSFQIPIGVSSGRGEGNAFDPGLIPGLEIDHFDVETLSFDPSNIHPQKHFGPVLGLGPPRAGIDGNDGVAPIVPVGQHEVEGKLPDSTPGIANIAGNLLDRLGIGHLQSKIEQYFTFFQIGLDRSEPFDLVRKQGPLFQDVRVIFRSIPESLLGDNGFDFR